MSWRYYQQTGQLFNPQGGFIATGYAGRGVGKNNPAYQQVHDVGPLPRGLYDMGDPIDHPHLGKFAIPLTPHKENEMFGRAGFYMHGDNPAHLGDSSLGCPVQPLFARHRVSESDDRVLEVV